MTHEVTLEELLVRNQKIATKHQAQPSIRQLAEQQKSLSKTLVLTCADPRADPMYYLDTAPGEIIIFRNTGGQVAPLLNDILAIDTILNLERILVVHHTDCGTLMINSDHVRDVLQKRDPEAAGLETAHLCGISDIPQSVKNDVKLLKESKLVREDLKKGIHGLVYDIFTGKLEIVV